MERKRILLGLILSLLCLGQSVTADIIFDNLSGGVRMAGMVSLHDPDGYTSWDPFLCCTDTYTDSDYAMPFTTAGGGYFILEGIEVAVCHVNLLGEENYFEVSLVADDGGLPGDTVIETWSFTDEAIASGDIIDVSPADGVVDDPMQVTIGAASLTYPTLSPNKTYWLVMSAGTGGLSSYVRWLQADSDSNVHTARRIVPLSGSPDCEIWRRHRLGRHRCAFRLSGLPLQVSDADGDGVLDADDACPDSDLSATVVVLGCDTGVENELSADGCTISDLIAVCLSIGQDSSIGENSSIGDNSTIGDNTHIGSDTEIGDDVNIGDRALIGSGATVGEDAEIGEGATVGGTLGEGSIIGFQTTVGANPELGEKTIIGASSSIGDNFTIAEDGSIGSDVTIGDDVTIGQKVTVGKGVTIGDGVLIGNEVTIGHDVTIGDGAIISDGATVTQDVP